jgi:hypothetical protein
MADQSEAVLGDRDGDIDRRLDRGRRNAAKVIKFSRPWTAKTRNCLLTQPSGADCVTAHTSAASVAATNGAIRAIVIIAGLLISTGAANAIECQSSPAPSNKNQWAWRLVDNKKCWYAGEPGMDKSKLRWAANADRALERTQRAVRKPACPLLSSQRCALNLHGQLKLKPRLLFASRLASATLIGRTACQALTAGLLPYPFRRGLRLLELKATLPYNLQGMTRVARI